MQKFGKFIDDIRKSVKNINISFKETTSGDCMDINIKDSKKICRIDTKNVGKIEYDTEMYNELLEMTIEQLNGFLKK